MHVSKITQKGQTTIPASVRKQLDLHAGDSVGFDTVDGKVILIKVSPFDYQYHKALEQTLSEWSSSEDDEAYNDL